MRRLEPPNAQRIAEALTELPSETDAHYTLLVSAIALLASFFAVFVAFGLGGFADLIEAQLISARVVGERLPPGGSVTDLPPELLGALADAQVQHGLAAVGSLTPLLFVPLAAVTTLFAAAAGIRFLWSALLPRRLRAVSFTERDLAEVFVALRSAGAKTLQKIYLVPNQEIKELKAWRANGFGRNHYILIQSNPQLIASQRGQSVLAKSLASPSEFTAGLLHEAAHLQSGDVDRVNRSLALQVTFYALLVGPFFIALALAPFFGVRIGNFALIAAQFALLIAVIWALWAALLRVREFYADWWAASIGGLHDDLADLLERTEHERLLHEQERIARTQNPLLRLWMASARWRTPWRHHPSEQNRVDRIENPALLCRLDADLATLTGLTLALFLIGIPALWGIGLGAAGLGVSLAYAAAPTALAIGGSGLLSATLLLLGVLFPLLIIGALAVWPAWLVARTIGTQIVRAQYVEGSHVADARPYFSLFRPALGFTAGLTLGLLALPFTFFVPRSQIGLAAMGFIVLFFGVMFWLWMVYVRALAARWVRGPARALRRQKGCVTGLATIAFVLLLAAMAPALLGINYDARIVDLFVDAAQRSDFERGYIGGTILFLTFFFIVGFSGFIGLTLLIGPRSQQPLASPGLSADRPAQLPAESAASPAAHTTVGPPRVTTAPVLAGSRLALMLMLGFCGLALSLCGPTLLIASLTMQMPVGSALDRLAFQVVRYGIPVASCGAGLILMAIAGAIAVFSRRAGAGGNPPQKEYSQ